MHNSTTDSSSGVFALSSAAVEADGERPKRLCSSVLTLLGYSRPPYPLPPPPPHTPFRLSSSVCLCVFFSMWCVVTGKCRDFFPLHKKNVVELSQKSEDGAGGEGWGSMEDNVAFQFSLGPAKSAVVLTIMEEVNLYLGSTFSQDVMLERGYTRRTCLLNELFVLQYNKRIKVKVWHDKSYMMYCCSSSFHKKL